MVKFIMSAKNPKNKHQNKPSLFTIGHSTRTISQFIELLKAHGVEKVVDVRTIPKSRHNPQFNQDCLRLFLKSSGIAYKHMAHLGGLRRAKKGSANLGWRNASFRGFADYMATAEFAAGLESLKNIAKKKKVAIMCAEAVPWRCHRSLIADALTKEGWLVFHIQSKKTAHKHKLTPFLKIKNGKLIYPSDCAIIN